MIGTVGLACVVATLVASYVASPWGSDVATPSSLDQTVRAVEIFSGAITFSILAISLRCLWSAWRVSHATSGAGAGSCSGPTAYGAGR